MKVQYSSFKRYYHFKSINKFNNLTMDDHHIENDYL